MSLPGELGAAGDVDEFRLLRPLGQGGMGTVYLAHDTLLDRNVALKLIRSGTAGPDQRARFLIEARAIARLSHPNVVAIYRAGTSRAGDPYLVQELIRGQTLAALPRPLPVHRACELALGVARGLAAAHRRGILHRDVKPANVMVDETGTARLLDFGIAKLLGAEHPSLAAPDPRRDLAPTAPALEPHAGGIAQTADAPMAPPAATADTPVAVVAEALASTADATASVAGVAPPADARTGSVAADAKVARARAGVAETADAPAGVAETADAPPDAIARAPRDGQPAGASPEAAIAAAHRDRQRAANAEEREHAPSPSPTSTDAVVGTPRYLAPEAWRGAPATVRTDLYSFGVMLYELLAGAPPFAHGERIELERAVIEGPAPQAIGERVAGLDADLAELVMRCLERDPERRPGSADEVAHALERVLTGAPPLPEGNPYPGLAPFDVSHRAVFYGRGTDVSAIVDRLRAESIVVITGDSGVGKSSVCRAGIAPAITGGALGDGRRWEVRFATVGRRPATALRDVLGLRGDDAPTASQLAATLANQAGAGLVVIIDQLEELITVADAAEAAAAAELIAALAGEIPGIKVVLAVRGDFVTRVASFAALAAVIPRGLQFLRLLDPAAVREAVVGPARAKGVRFASNAMIRELVDAVTDDAGTLPLLQFALAELWHRRDLDTGVIPASATTELGGVSGALARHADGVLASLAVEQRTAARRILLALVTRDGTRATRERPELAAEPVAAAALEALVRSRLVVARDNAGDEPVYTLAHESLLTAWGTLHTWLDDAAGQRGLRARVSSAADEWHRLDRRADLLWRRAQLVEVAALDDLTERDRTFLDASRRAATRRRAIAIVVALAIPAAALATWLGYRAAEQRDRDREVARRVTTADAYLATAEVTAAVARGARERAYLAFDHSARDAEDQWREARTITDAALAAYRDATSELEAALISGGDRADVRERMAEVIYRHALAIEASGDDKTAAELVRRVAIHGGRAQLDAWDARANAVIESPGAIRIAVRRYVDQGGRLVLDEPILVTAGSRLATDLAPGSYSFQITGSDGLVVDDPVVLARGERFAQTLHLPRASAIPKDFVYVPPGRFLVGSEADEDTRTSHLLAPPLHQAATRGYLIGRFEVTFANWIEYLSSLSPAQRAKRQPPSITGTGTFAVDLHATPSAEYTAALGVPITYTGREHRREQRWEQMPVTEISFLDVIAYTKWLDAVGRVPHARLCTSNEWERAVRGADRRTFPHGFVLAVDDANFDETYDRNAKGFGLDEIGSHPRSTSPFGVADLAGNVWEFVRTSAGKAEVRGGSYYHQRFSLLVTNHSPIEETSRLVYAGARICADLP